MRDWYSVRGVRYWMWLAVSLVAFSASPSAAPARHAAVVSLAAIPIPCPFCNTDPIEPVWSEQASAATRIKSPAQYMHFTAGVPFRILADALDTNLWMCPPGH